MKKIFIAALFVCSLLSTVFASSVSKENSKAALNLETKYAAAKNVTWTVSNNFEKATFTLGDEKMEAYYDANGDFIGSFKSMAYDKLPKDALDILTTEYTFPDYQLLDCIEFTDSDNNKNYFISYAIGDDRVILEISSNGTVTTM